MLNSGLDKGPQSKLFFLFLNQNICCGYLKEPSQWEHDEKLFTLAHSYVQIMMVFMPPTLIKLKGHFAILRVISLCKFNFVIKISQKV